MGFVVLPALVPDISAVYDVYFEAFKNNEVTRALFPSASEADLTDARSEFRQGHTAHVLEWWKTSATQYTIKCVDTETNRIVGMALYDVYIAPSDWKRGEISWLQGLERERAESLINPLWEAREKLWLNQRYIYCHVMAVHPEFQRRGIGELIFKFGTSIAEHSGIPVYVESSKEGVKLYEKVGCQRLKETLKLPLGKIPSGATDDTKEDRDHPLFVWLPKAGEACLPKAVQLA